MARQNHSLIQKELSVNLIKKKFSKLLSGAFWGILGLATSAQSATVIKFAIVTPEGSTWSKVVNEFNADLQQKTQNQVSLKVYSGGVSGDELDVLRKMRSQNIHGGGFSGVGLGAVVPEIRILEAPLLFNSYDQIDSVKKQMFNEFADKFRAKGYELLGFAEGGFVYLFAKEPLANAADLLKTKMWVWKGDQVAETFLTSFGIRTVPLDLADVNTGLSTGMIDAFYSPPLVALAFQWYPKVKHMMNYKFVNSIGGMLVTNEAFAKMTPAEQQTFRQLGQQYCDKLVAATRKENDEALAALKAAGIVFHDPSPADVAQFQQFAESTYRKSVPAIYSQALLDKVKGIIR